MLLKEFVQFIIENGEETNPGKVRGGRAASITSPKKENRDVSKEELALAKKIIDSIEQTTYWTNKDLGSGKTDASILKDLETLIEKYQDNNRYIIRSYQLMLQLWENGKEIGGTSTQTDVQEAYQQYIWFNDKNEHAMIMNARDNLKRYYFGESNE